MAIYHMIRTTSSAKAMPDGPLESMFPVASSKILDFLSTHKLWDYSVSDIAKYSGVSFKTALAEIRKTSKPGCCRADKNCWQCHNVQVQHGIKASISY